MTNGSENISINQLDGIGERIKRLRKQKRMTQQELADGEITRNMLSRIENGYALPSLPTLIHLASRLEIPCACLLDETALEEYNRSKVVRNAREYMKSGNFDAALELIRSSQITIDDELALILIECDLALAGRLTSERKYLDAYFLLSDAITNTGNTVYSTAGSGYIADLYRSLAKRTLPLKKEPDQSPALPDFDKYIDIYIYIRLLDLLDNGQLVKAINLASLCEIRDRILSAHVAAKLDMTTGRYREAASKLTLILESEESTPTVHGGLMLYRIYEDLEQCAKGENDYVLAYTYKEQKLKLYSKMSGIEL